MARPIIRRKINFWPKATYFKPAGIPLNTIQEIELLGDEIEAIRLKDLKGLEQIEVAKNMQVSRPTVVRILQSARRKIAEGLINGKAIKFEKGNNIIFCPRGERRKRLGRAF